MVNSEELISEFREVVSKPQNKYIREWTSEGRHVVGYFCTFVPSELFLAAGILPIRIRGAGSTDSSSADTYLSHRICPFVRHATALALEEHYDFLDGEISLNTCDHVRRACDIWRLKTGIRFHGFLSVPRNCRESLYPWFREEVENLKGKVEEYFSVKITDDSLMEAIKLQNDVRRRLMRLSNMRRRVPAPITGGDALAVSIASLLIPRDKWIELADQLLDQLEDHGLSEKARARIVLAGGELDEPDFVDVIESQGARVVGDSACFGVRYSDQLVPEDGDPFDAICRASMFNTSCARMIGGYGKRFEELERLVRECRADGVIFQKMKFCDPWGSDQYKTMVRYKHMNKPLLVLDREYGVTATGQIKTRAQAFLEALGK